MNQQQKKKKNYKFIVLGKAAVGKSCLSMRYVFDNFNEEYNPTLQDTFRKDFNINGQEGVLEILDTAGQEEYAVMQEHWIKEGHGFILVYSIIDPESFSEISQIQNRIFKVCNKKSLPIIIVGNKSDLENQRQVSKEQLKEFAQRYMHVECSAKTGDNCNYVFDGLLEMIIKKQIEKKNKVPNQNKENSFCNKICNII